MNMTQIKIIKVVSNMIPFAVYQYHKYVNRGLLKSILYILVLRNYINFFNPLLPKETAKE